MTRRAERELRSICQRLDSIRMTESERQAAVAAMHDAYRIVEACEWVAHKISRLRALFFGKPSLGH